VGTKSYAIKCLYKKYIDALMIKVIVWLSPSKKLEITKTILFYFILWWLRFKSQTLHTELSSRGQNYIILHQETQTIVIYEICL